MRKSMFFFTQFAHRAGPCKLGFILSVQIDDVRYLVLDSNDTARNNSAICIYMLLHNIALHCRYAYYIYRTSSSQYVSRLVSILEPVQALEITSAKRRCLQKRLIVSFTKKTYHGHLIKTKSQSSANILKTCRDRKQKLRNETRKWWRRSQLKRHKKKNP